MVIKFNEVFNLYIFFNLTPKTENTNYFKTLIILVKYNLYPKLAF